jgi:hypothetical protein
MLTEEHTKEDLSRAYVLAVAAKASVIVNLNNRSHDYGIDGSFHKVSNLKGRRVESGVTIDFQLKATSRDIIREDYVSITMDASTNNCLAKRYGQPGCNSVILIVLCLPSDSMEWLQLSEDELILRKCCYWSKISAFTSNLSTCIIEIPRSQMFTPEVLESLLERISIGQPV